MKCKLTVFRLETVYMARSIGRLRGNIFVEWVPSHSLHVMIVLCYLPYHLPCEKVSPSFASYSGKKPFMSSLSRGWLGAPTRCGQSLYCLKLE